jgi:phage-related tail protein
VERSTFGGLAQNYYTQAVISYMSDKEARIAEEMMDAVVLHNGLVNTTADTTVKAKIGTLVTAVINQQADGNGNFRGLAPDFAALATDVYEDLSTVDTDAGVAFGSGNAQIGSMMGTLGTLRIVLAPGLDSGGIIVGAAAATELRDGNELQLRSLIVNTLSYELGVNANCSIDVEYPNALAANNDAFS